MNKALYFLLAAASAATITACGGGGSATTNSSDVLPVAGVNLPTAALTAEQQLVRTIETAQINYIKTDVTKTVIVNGYNTSILAGTVYATLKEDFTAIQLDQLMTNLAEKRIPVVGLQRGGYTVQLGVTSSLDEAGVIAAIKSLPAIKSADYSYPSSGGGEFNSSTVSLVDSNQPSTLMWWEQAAGFISARSKLNLTPEKECTVIEVRTAVADDEFESGHGARVANFLAGSGSLKAFHFAELVQAYHWI